MLFKIFLILHSKYDLLQSFHNQSYLVALSRYLQERACVNELRYPSIKRIS